MARREGPGALRGRIRRLLAGGDIDAVLEALGEIPARRVASAVIPALYTGDERVRWMAVAALGHTVARLAGEDMEAARVVMRRLMWSLNDESGGIGWGAPEAMAEAMAGHGGLAEEYTRILFSYIRKDANYLEYSPLRRGALWGVARLARTRPGLFRGLDCARHIRPYLEDADPAARALAALALAWVGEAEDCRALEALSADPAGAVLRLGPLEQRTGAVGAFAAEAAARCRARCGDPSVLGGSGP